MNQFRLLGKRRFAPFFAVQSLAAFNDNAFRNATIVLVGFQLGLTTGQIGLYSNLAPALFILPFFLFSASAGQLAEKYEKHTLIRWVKVFEIAAMCVAAWGFYARSPALLFVVLFLMGLHSTLFGPIKYAILPQVLRREELVGGNALVETGTSIAILVGMIAGGAAMASHFGWAAAAALVIGVALLGLIASFAIPRVPAAAPDLKFNWNFIAESGRVLKLTGKQRAVFNSILGISWFWFFGGVVTAQLPNYTRLYLGGGASVEILVLALFSVPGRGSTFSVQLPLAGTTPLAADTPQGSSPRTGVSVHVAATDRASPATDDAARPRVLLVEDDPVAGQAIAGLIESFGYAVTLAPQALAALAEIDATGGCDLVVCDFDLPGMDGCEMAELLRQRGVAVPIVALTASAHGDEEQRALAAGMNAFLRKPVLTEDLRDVLGHATRPIDRAAVHAD